MPVVPQRNLWVEQTWSRRQREVQSRGEDLCYEDWHREHSGWDESRTEGASCSDISYRERARFGNASSLRRMQRRGRLWKLCATSGIARVGDSMARSPSVRCRGLRPAARVGVCAPASIIQCGPPISIGGNSVAIHGSESRRLTILVGVLTCLDHVSSRGLL